MEDVAGDEVLLLHAEPPALCPEDVDDLFAAAGAGPELARAWTKDGRLYTLRDAAADPGEPPVALALLLPVGAGETTVNLRVVVVRPDVRGRGYGRRLLDSVADEVRRNGARKIISPAPNGDVALYTLLQKGGFRPAYVERDACRGEAGYPVGLSSVGIDNRDVLWFELAL